MPRPTRAYPWILRSDTPASREVRDMIGRTLGESAITAVDRVARRVTVFRVSGEDGIGLLAESDQPLAERAGVFRNHTSIWLRGAGAPASQVLEVELHSFDLWTEALATGDDRWTKASRRAMYAERDRRTAAVAAELDHGDLFDVPADAVPALLAGLNPSEVRALAERHVPELLPGWSAGEPPPR